MNSLLDKFKEDLDPTDSPKRKCDGPVGELDALLNNPVKEGMTDQYYLQYAEVVADKRFN